jgi:hypothetical protein
MIVSAAQPYFCPYPEYFARAVASDIFVILDAVQFPLGSTWITRNRFKNDSGAIWLSIPVWKKGLGLQMISEVKICPDGRWQRKHRESIIQAYHHAPYLEEHRDFFQALFSSGFETIVHLNMHAITHVMTSIRATTKVVLLSDLGIEEKGSKLIVEICRALSGTCYLAPAPAGKYLDEDIFRKGGIELAWFRQPTPVYPQLWGDFLPNLSVFDLILNCGPKAEEMIKKKYSVSRSQDSE